MGYSVNFDDEGYSVTSSKDDKYRINGEVVTEQEYCMFMIERYVLEIEIIIEHLSNIQKELDYANRMKESWMKRYYEAG